MSTCYLMGSVPMYGGSPSFISKAMMPRDQMSTLYSCTFICICIYIYVCVFVLVYICIFVCICICICICFMFIHKALWCPKFHLGVICLLVHNLERKIRSKVDLCKKKLLFSSLRLKRNAVRCQICLSGLPSLLTSGAIQYGVPAIVILFSPASIFDGKIRFSDFRNQN